MKRLMLILTSITLLSGCAEFQAIKTAAFNEMNADVVSQETVLYRHQSLAQGVLTADVAIEKNRAPESLMVIALAGKMNSSSSHYQKGLWER